MPNSMNVLDKRFNISNTSNIIILLSEVWTFYHYFKYSFIKNIVNAWPSVETHCYTVAWLKCRLLFANNIYRLYVTPNRNSSRQYQYQRPTFTACILYTKFPITDILLSVRAIYLIKLEHVNKVRRRKKVPFHFKGNI